jgi:hemerythrin-like domain-containing protein
MKATEILSSEHRVIERVMSALEIGAERVEKGIAIRPGFFIQATDFIKGFADGCHHRKEEGVLFPALVANGMPVENGPVGVMLAEHEQGRDFTRKLRAAALAWESGDASAKPAVIENARGYAQLLKQHIFKEDHVLFPAADRVLPAAQQDAVMEGFEHVEHEETGEGVHAKYLAMAEALET